MRDPDWDTARAMAHRAGVELAARLPGPDTVPLAQACGRVLAAPLRSLHTLPHYASSAMDGWAVAGTGPWALEHGTGPLAGGTARPIVTGGLVPQGTTAVLRRERARASGTGVLEADAQPAPGTDIRPAGQEAARGELLLEAGERLAPGAIAVAAVAGHDHLAVAPPVPVHLVYTGDEVVTSGIPRPGHVRDSFGPVLPACVTGLGGTPASTLRIGDERAATLEAIDGQAARAAQIVVTTGGTGGSAADHLRPAARELGATALVDSIAMRPGHPVFLARFPDGRLLLALPGNPLAALMAVATVLGPVLRGATGRPPERTSLAVAGTDIPALRGGHRLLPARWEDRETHRVLVPAEHTGSAMMRGLAAADVVLVVPPGGHRAGGSAAYLPLPW
jgi:molybdopterin molybdotransferase